MRILALIFSAISFYGLLLLVNVEIYHFMPASAGPEGGLIDGALGLMFGGIASLVALLFAFLHFRRARSARLSRLLRRGTTFIKCAIAFSVAWLAFYVMWSWSIIFAARIIFARMIRITDEAFLMFAGSSGQQFDTWDRDSNMYFLTATLPFMIA